MPPGEAAGTSDASSSEQQLSEMVPLLYAELRRLASHYLRRERGYQTLQTTALVHEAYLRLVEQKHVNWQNREQFLGIAANLMRRILVDHSRRHHAAKRGGNAEKIFLEEALMVSKERAADVIALDEALSKLAEVDQQQCRLVELRFFGGLTLEEAAGVLGITPPAAKRDWSVAKAWLARSLRTKKESHG